MSQSSISRRQTKVSVPLSVIKTQQAVHVQDHSSYPLVLESPVGNGSETASDPEMDAVDRTEPVQPSVENESSANADFGQAEETGRHSSPIIPVHLNLQVKATEEETSAVVEAAIVEAHSKPDAPAKPAPPSNKLERKGAAQPRLGFKNAEITQEDVESDQDDASKTARRAARTIGVDSDGENEKQMAVPLEKDVGFEKTEVVTAPNSEVKSDSDNITDPSDETKSSDFYSSEPVKRKNKSKKPPAVKNIVTKPKSKVQAKLKGKMDVNTRQLFDYGDEELKPKLKPAAKAKRGRKRQVSESENEAFRAPPKRKTRASRKSEAKDSDDGFDTKAKPSASKKSPAKRGKKKVTDTDNFAGAFNLPELEAQSQLVDGLLLLIAEPVVPFQVPVNPTPSRTVQISKEDDAKTLKLFDDALAHELSDVEGSEVYRDPFQHGIDQLGRHELPVEQSPQPQRQFSDTSEISPVRNTTFDFACQHDKVEAVAEVIETEDVETAIAKAKVHIAEKLVVETHIEETIQTKAAEKVVAPKKSRAFDFVADEARANTEPQSALTRVYKHRKADHLSTAPRETRKKMKPNNAISITLAKKKLLSPAKELTASPLLCKKI